MDEAATHCGLTSEDILLFISFEWIRPYGIENLIFDEADLVRLQLILELKEQMGINNEGITVILHLVDQLNHLHLELQSPPPHLI